MGAAAPTAAEWTPPDYPFTREEARQFLQDLRSFKVQDLESLRHALTGAGLAGQMRRQAEEEALAQFCGGGEALPPWELLRRHAHKILLWLWRMEEQLAEVTALEARCAATEAALGHNFSEYDWAPIPQREAASTLPLPDLWRVCLTHAAVFIPAAIPILATGAMREDLLERFSPQPMPQWGGAVVGFWAPLGQVLSPASSRTPHCPYPPDPDERGVTLCNETRLWLALL